MSNERVLGHPVGRRNNTQYCACYDAAAHDLNNDRESFQGFISSTTCHAIFAFLAPLLVGVVQVKYQNKSQSPFETRPVTMWAFVLATVTYVFALAVSMNGKTKSQLLFGNLALLAGSLSSVSLLSVLLPTLPGSVIFVIWVFLPVMLARDFIKRACFWVYGRIKDTICKILGIEDGSSVLPN